jgi:hypothetical protein
MSKIQNSIWIKNTNKTGQETMNLLKLLKDLGVFKEKPKKRKAKRKEQEINMEAEDEFLTPPTGGGGGGGSVGVVPPSSDVTNALVALKSAASSDAQREYNLKQLKEQAEGALGKLRDQQQNLAIQQQRAGFGFQPSAPRIDFLEEETGTDFFPPKDIVVPPTNYEMEQERSGTDNPDEVMKIDISPVARADEGQVEDIKFEEQPQTFEELVKEQVAKSQEKISQQEQNYADKFQFLADQYDLRGLSDNAKLPDLKTYLIYLYNTFGIKPPKTAISKMTKSVVQNEIRKIIAEQYDLLA